jgi:hypothetical protein
MTDREALPDPGRDRALTIAARLFGDERHIPRRSCAGCGGAGGARGGGAVSWDCDASGPTVNGDWSPAFRAWSDYQYAAFMHQHHDGADPGPAPAKPGSDYHVWTYSFTWAQIRERAESLAVGEQTGAFEALAPTIEPTPAPAAPAPVSQVSAPEPPTCARCRHAIRNTYGDGSREHDGRLYHGRCLDDSAADGSLAADQLTLTL